MLRNSCGENRGDALKRSDSRPGELSFAWSQTSGLGQTSSAVGFIVGLLAIVGLHSSTRGGLILYLRVRKKPECKTMRDFTPPGVLIRVRLTGDSCPGSVHARKLL